MKTDQLISVAFTNGSLDIYHKSQMGSLKDLFKLGNKYRLNDDKELMRMDIFLKKESTRKFIEDLSTELNLEKSEILTVKGRGRGAKTFANLHFLIYCAEELNNRFRIAVIDTFINNQILKNRDDGGNDFKELNQYLDKLEDRKGKNNQGIFIQTAIKLRAKIFTDTQIEECKEKNINIWNTSYATSDKLNLRDTFEKQLIFSIKMEFIKSYDDIKKVIAKL
jgi:hypothetical protein